MSRVLSVATLLLLGMATGISFSHLLQWSPKATLSAEYFLAIQQVLFSRYRLGAGLVDGLAVVALAICALLWRADRLRLVLVLVALTCLVLMIGIWAIWINPINAEVISWAASSIPAGWESARDTWHRLHATRLVLGVVALAAFGWAVTDHTRYTKK